MTFSQALNCVIVYGAEVQRAGWNGKGMYVFARRTAGDDPYLCMFTAHGTVQPGWIPSQADMFAADWELR